MTLFKRHPYVLVMQELQDFPLFFSLHSISGTVKCTSPSAVMFRSAVINAGYQISSSHVNPLGLKSDAPWDVIWDIMRCWVNIDLYRFRESGFL
jgi:tRNA (guanine26-N2/guanine27-N2)-dimethyltransferase